MFVLVVDMKNISGKSNDLSVVVEFEEVGRNHDVRALQILLPQNFFNLENNFICIGFRRCGNSEESELDNIRQKS